MKQSIRDLEKKDLSIIREWRNHSKINKFMFSNEIITEEAHVEWFRQVSESLNHNLYIYEEDKIMLGFIQIQQNSVESKVFEWGFYISPYAEKGTGSRMTQLMLEKIFRDLGGKKVYARVLDFNFSSIKLHEKLGFQNEGVLRNHHCMKDKYYDIYCFGLLDVEWVESKKLLAI